MIDENARLEDALQATETDVERALKSATALVALLKRARKSAEKGSVRELERGLDQAKELAAETREAISAARAGWRFDIREHLESGGYRRELLSLAKDRGVRLYEQDERIVSFPSLVRVLPADAAVEVDRKRQREIRPSALIDSLGIAQKRPPRFKAEQFLETLVRPYLLAVAENGKDNGDTVRLIDVYRILTLLPGTAYTVQEFARDIYLLDESGVAKTRDGLQLELPASSGARSSHSLPAVTRSGDVKVYYGIAFR